MIELRPARIAPTAAARCTPDTNACLDADASTACADGGSFTPSAPAIDDRAADASAWPSPRKNGAMWLAYRDAATLPRIAMPSAAPSSRVASFIADPAPARRAGTAIMIDAVIGDIVIAMPVVSGITQITT